MVCEERLEIAKLSSGMARSGPASCPARTKESCKAAATPATEPPTHLPLPPRSHNAPIVHSSAGMPPREQLRAQGLGRALNPGHSRLEKESSDLHGAWRILESGGQGSLEKLNPGIRRPQVLRLQAVCTAGMAQFQSAFPSSFLFFHLKLYLLHLT